MTAIALPPPSQTSAYTWRLPSARWADNSVAQGVEGQRLYEAAEEARRHWNERAEVLVAGIEDAEDLSYVSVPPNRVLYVKTRYVFAGKGMPRYFDLGNE